MENIKNLTDQGKLALLTTFGKAWAAADVDLLMSMMTDDCVYAARLGISYA